MIAYHLDKTNSLQVGQKIELDRYFNPNNEVGKSIITDMYPDGISRHGQQYLSDKIFYSQENTINEYQKFNNWISSSLTEYNFELVRQTHFPNLFSRFQSFFAFENPNQLSEWYELAAQSATLFEIEFDDNNFMKLDSKFLKGGLFFGSEQPQQYYLGFSPMKNLQVAFDYWGKKHNDSPRYELLIKPPVLIKSKLHSISGII